MEKGRVLSQILVAFDVYLCEIACGINTGFSTIIIPQLQEKNEIFKTKEQMSWIASLFYLGLIIGSPLGGVLAGRVGLKTTICVGCLVQLPGWILIAGADNLEMIYIGRTLTGISVGLTFSNGKTLLSDISEPRLRGTLQAFAVGCINLGCILIYFTGAFLEWRWTCLLAPSFFLSSFLISHFIPESPIWLVSKGKIESAAIALLWLRGKHYNVEFELRHIREAIEANPVNLTWRDKMRTFVQTRVLKPFALVTFLMFIQKSSGMAVVISYTVTVLQASSNTLNEYFGAVIIGTSFVTGNILSGIFLGKFERRPILMASFFSCSLTMGLLGLSFHMLISHEQFVTEIWKWVVLFSLIAFAVCFSCGVGTVPYLLMTEIYPKESSVFVAGLTISFNYMFTFLSVKLFPMFEWTMSLCGTFWLYTGLNLMGIIATFFFVPETKGKTFAELQAL